MMAKEIPDFGVRQFLLKNMYRKDDKSFGWRMNLDAISSNIESLANFKLPNLSS